MNRRFRYRLRDLFYRKRLDRDLEDELRFHMDMLAEQRPDARRQFGNLAHFKETCRNMHSLSSLELCFQDIRFAWRTLAKAPGFTAVAVIALALGIGANAFVFSLVNALLFKNLPFPDSGRILYVGEVRQSRGSPSVSLPDYMYYRAHATSFEDLGAFSRTPCTLSGGLQVAEGMECARITTNTFRILGVQPALGRDLLPEDQQPGAPSVVLLTYAIWESHYGKEPSIIGKQVRIDSTPATVIGVMPRGIGFPGESSLYIPQDASGERNIRYLTVFGRLRPGLTVALAKAEMEKLSEDLARAYPATNQNLRAIVQNFNDVAIKKNIRMMVFALLGAVGFVLLIACCNVANLLLARAIGRAREISIRTALGASRWRIVRQLLAESVMLSFAGGASGCLLATWCVRAFDIAVIPTGKPAWIDFSMDYRVLGYVTLVSLLTGILFGLAPALRVSRADLQSVMKEGGRGAITGPRGRYLTGAFVVAEMALAVVLLTGAGVMVRSFLKYNSTPSGINSANVLTAQIELPPARYNEPAKQMEMFGRLEGQLAALPGVESVTAASRLPGESATFFPGYEVEGSAPAAADDRPIAGTLYITPNYFQTFQAQIGRGRAFTDADQSTAAPVAIVNEAFAARAWPTADPLGKRFRIVESSGPHPWVTVIGTASNIAQGRASTPEPLIYLPYQRTMRYTFAVALRTRVPPVSLTDALRRAVQTTDADLPIRGLSTLEEFLRLRSWDLRVFAAIFAIFAAIAFLLASVGLYAVIAHSVSQRTQEIGVRLAMGAPASRVLRMVFAQGMRQLAIGLAIGLPGAAAVSSVLRSIADNVPVHDPVTFTAVTLSLVGAGILGCAIPARRAVRVDPAVTLRHD